MGNSESLDRLKQLFHGESSSESVTGTKQSKRKKPSSKKYPVLPDGTLFTDFGESNTDDDAELVNEARRVLDNLNSTYVLGREHTHLIKIILSEYLRARKMQYSDDPKVMAELRQLEADIFKRSAQLGLIQKHKATDTPLEYIRELQRRAVELMAERGASKSTACPKCGEIILVYQGTTHPFLSDMRYAVWSPEIWEYVTQKKCDCGLPKLTLEEAAYILRVSPIGLEQIAQQVGKDGSSEDTSTEKAPVSVQEVSAQEIDE